MWFSKKESKSLPQLPSPSSDEGIDKALFSYRQDSTLTQKVRRIPDGGTDFITSHLMGRESGTQTIREAWKDSDTNLWTIKSKHRNTEDQPFNVHILSRTASAFELFDAVHA
jgi:hypothetical protein